MNYFKSTKKILLLFTVLSLSFQFMIAQGVAPKMSFDHTKYDFGKIKEDGGPVTHVFKFTNTGSEPVVIQSVNASCGCTTPTWSKAPVLAGQTGTITAVFRPINRPGVFNKSITVTSNAENSPVTLYVSGTVLKKEAQIADKYRYNMSGLRLKTTNVHVGDITNAETKEKTIEVINASKEDIKIGFNERRRMPAHLTVTAIPETLKPNQKGIIKIVYDASKKNDWGYVYDRIYVNVNGNFDSKQRITISGTITESFTEDQKANPPVMTFTEGTEFDFGTIKQGDVVEHVFPFKNTGKNDLIIRKTRASCGCTAIAPKDKIIKPGQESSIKAVFNSRGKHGRQHKTITITTNIPGKTSVILKVVGEVEVPEKQDNTNK